MHDKPNWASTIPSASASAARTTVLHVGLDGGQHSVRVRAPGLNAVDGAGLVVVVGDSGDNLGIMPKSELTGASSVVSARTAHLATSSRARMRSVLTRRDIALSNLDGAFDVTAAVDKSRGTCHHLLGLLCRLTVPPCSARNGFSSKARKPPWSSGGCPAPITARHDFTTDAKRGLTS
jgi:hypothetical protein